MPRLRPVLLRNPALKREAREIYRLLDTALREQDLRSRADDFVAQLPAVPYGSFINRFRKQVLARGHDYVRCWHGIYRALAPLMDDGLEFTVEELKTKNW